MAKVYVICTGGTISMLDVSKLSQHPTTSFQDEVKKILPSGNDYPEVDFHVYSPLIDSSEMTVELWNKIGADIREKYHEYDGFVVLHGTDTMAFTGSALSFMLVNLGKPVILTGAQTPLSENINDARENIINSIFLAGYSDINEVCISFNRTIYRANRVTKFSTNDYDAYISANYPALGRIQSSIEIDKHLLLPTPPNTDLSLAVLENHDIRYIYITPNLKPDVFAKMIAGASAVIIGSYGDGNIKIRDDSCLKIIKAERDKGMVFVNKSQCLRSNTVPKYDAGSLLADSGMVSGGDQTMESLVCKLLYLFSRKLKPREIENAMKTSLRGELTTISALKQKFSFFTNTEASTTDTHGPALPAEHKLESLK